MTAITPFPLSSALCVSLTAVLHFASSAIFSPRLYNVILLSYGKSTSPRHTKKHFQYLVLGNLLHSMVVSSLSVVALYNNEYNSDSQVSWAAITAGEISFTFFVMELLTVVTRFPNIFLQDKADLLHHVSGTVGLFLALCHKSTGLVIEMSAIRLLSQFSIPFLLLRLILLDCGRSDTLTYLLVFSVMILGHFLSRIVVIPFFWLIFSEFALTLDIAPLYAILLGSVSLSLDLLNMCWLKQMIHTYFKYYPSQYRVVLRF